MVLGSVIMMRYGDMRSFCSRRPLAWRTALRKERNSIVFVLSGVAMLSRAGDAVGVLLELLGD